VIGIQLDLFGDLLVPHVSRDLEADVPAEAPDASGPQLDLFADRHVRLERARRLLIDARARDAVRELRDLRHRYPDDPVIGAELELARDVERRLDAVDAAAPGERPQLLAALARTAPAEHWPALLRRTAAALRQLGPAALLDGRAASVLLLEAGDLDSAQAAAEAAVAASRRARFIAYLADVEIRRDLCGLARERYRAALAQDPDDIDWDAIADADVRSLPEIARSEFELEDGVAWSAPVGVILDVLPLGQTPAISSSVAAAPQSGTTPLDRAQRFLSALVRDRHEPGRSVSRARLEARREMRALAPQLMAAYLESK
jgi:hypothetical protein